MKIEKLEAIIFDLGGVIINVDYNLTVQRFKQLALDQDEITYSKSGQEGFLDLFEKGEIPAAKFRANIVDRLGKFYPSDIIDSAWNAMILDFPKARFDYLSALKSSGIKLYLLSNINEVHEACVNTKLDQLGQREFFYGLFDRIYYSHQLGMRKPESEIFRAVVDQNSINMKAAIFIDDSLQHVEAARLVGLNAYHISPGERIEDLELLPRCKSNTV